MSIIFPGNYVARLNAYKAQGVEALPGVDFYSVIGVAYITGNNAINDVLTLKVPSPDLRQDDKPRLDKTMVVPEGALIYKSAIRVVNCKAYTGTNALASSVSPTTGNGGVALPAGVTCTHTSATVANGGAFTGGATSAFDFENSLGSVLGAETAITAKVTVNDLTKGDDAANHSVVIVEIGYFLPHSAPGLDDVNLTFITEAGSS